MASVSEFLRLFGNSPLLAKIKGLASKFSSRIVIDKRVYQIQKDLEKRVAMINSIMGNRLIGTTSPDSGIRSVGGYPNFTSRILWKALSRKYMERKGNRLFFIKTGDLRDQILQKNYVNKLGIFVQYKPSLASKKGLKIGDINVKVFYKIPRPQMDDLLLNQLNENMNLEFWMFGQKSRIKLRNKLRNQRPLVQPVLSYYIKTAIPAEIARSLKK